MKKTFCIVFVFLIISSSVIISSPSICQILGTPYFKKSQSGLASLIGNNYQIYSLTSNSNLNHEQVTYKTTDISVSKIIDLLGIRIIKVTDIKGELYINGISKLLDRGDGTVEILANKVYIVIGRPKII